MQLKIMFVNSAYFVHEEMSHRIHMQITYCLGTKKCHPLYFIEARAAKIEL